MGKVSAVQCDRCSAVFEEFDGRHRLRECKGRAMVYSWDLCKPCQADFERWMRGEGSVVSLDPEAAAAKREGA